MYNPVVSNAYEVALHMMKKMRKEGMISEAEFNRIDAENKRVFIRK